MPVSKSFDDWELPNDLKAIEARLAALSPRADRLNRERLVFLAGRASAERTRWPWPTSFAAMSAVAATLLFLLIHSSSVRDSAVQSPVDQTTVATQSPKFDTKDLPSSFTAATDPGRRVLSVADFHRLDPAQLLSGLDANRRPIGILPDRDDTRLPRTGRIITPASWDMLIDGRL